MRDDGIIILNSLYRARGRIRKGGLEIFGPAAALYEGIQSIMQKGFLEQN